MSFNFFRSSQPNEYSYLNLENELKDDISALVLKKKILMNSNVNLINTYTNRKPLIIHCCHHKTGTVVVEKILRNIAYFYGFKYQYCPQSKLEPDTDIWVENHSHIDFSKIHRPIIGTHMIRHPCSIIVSAFEYHKKTNEPWVNRKIKSFGKQSYKQILNSLNNENGLIFEMKNELYIESSKNTIMDMYNWDYYKPNFLELKFEDFMLDFDNTLRNMFKHYGFSKEMIEECLKMSQCHNIRNKSKEDIVKNKHITNKNMDLEKWKKYFLNNKILSQFKKYYPFDLFENLGYGTQDLTELEEINYQIKEPNEELKEESKEENKEKNKEEENKEKKEILMDKYWSKNLII